MGEFRENLRFKYHKTIYGIFNNTFIQEMLFYLGHSEETKFKIGLANAFTYKQVKEFIEIESNSGCKLLSKEYKNSNIELKIQCKCGNILKVSLKEVQFRDNQKK